MSINLGDFSYDISIEDVINKIRELCIDPLKRSKQELIIEITLCLSLFIALIMNKHSQQVKREETVEYSIGSEKERYFYKEAIKAALPTFRESKIDDQIYIVVGLQSISITTSR